MAIKNIPDLDNITIKDGPNLDAFGRLRIGNPEALFDSHFTYDLQPLIYEQITSGSGASIAHDATNRKAVMTFSSTPTGGKAFMQSYEFFHYQSGKSQKIDASFNFIEAKTNCLKFVGYSDGINGYEFQNNGTTNQFVLYSSSANGNQTVVQSSWNLDKMDGTGPSGLTLDITKAQILQIDFQALYTGRVRMGFSISGQIVYCHQFVHANLIVHPYIATANLPIRAGMTCTGTVSTTMAFTCAAVVSEGGSDSVLGYHFSSPDASVTAASGARTHLLSIRPKATFNSITNRIKNDLDTVELMVTGSNPVYWELVIGQAITGTTTFNDVNTNYSTFEYNTAGTISGNPALVIDAGYIYASNQSKTNISKSTTSKYPITLDQAGAVRLNGTVSLLVTGIGGTSAVRGSLQWIEVR